MPFHYPQAATEASGPTEVLPGTRYWTRGFEQDEGWRTGAPLDPTFNQAIGGRDDLALRDERLARSVARFGINGIRRQRRPLAAGSVALAHHDLLHRGTRREPRFHGRRYMVKCYSFRTREPCQAG